MQVIKIDVIRSQTVEAGVDGFGNGRGRQALVVGRVAHLAAHLRGQDDLVAAAPERLAQDSFRRAPVVDICRVKEVDARVEAAFHHALRGGWVGLRAESHRPEGEARNFESGLGKSAILHLHLLEAC